MRHGRTRDISGGGLYFETQEQILDQNVALAISFEIRDIEVRVRGRIIGSSHDKANGVHTYRLVFTDISHENQMLLAAYVLRNSLDAILTKASAASYQRARKPKQASIPQLDAGVNSSFRSDRSAISIGDVGGAKNPATPQATWPIPLR